MYLKIIQTRTTFFPKKGLLYINLYKNIRSDKPYKQEALLKNHKQLATHLYVKGDGMMKIHVWNDFSRNMFGGLD